MSYESSRKVLIYIVAISFLTGCVKSGLGGVAYVNELLVVSEECKLGLSVLKVLDPLLFNAYSEQIEFISDTYRLYGFNKKLGSDPSELFNITTEMKLHHICARIKYSVYQDINWRIDNLMFY